jgi:radical SAM superfamily enzyme YgiQ (UPF0313 family)
VNILLLNPPPKDRSWYKAEHLGLAYLAAVMRQAGHHVFVFDALLENQNAEQTYQAISSRFNNIQLLGITAMEPEAITNSIKIIRQLRSDGMNFHVTAGGYLPTFWCDELLVKNQEIDSVVIGEGEETFRFLGETLEQKGDLTSIPGLVFRLPDGVIVHNRPRPLIRDLDQLPFPTRDYLDVTYQKYHHALVYSSRGCYHRCSFCQVAQFYRKSTGVPYRTRSAKNIADEIEMLVIEYGVRSIFFVDDEFITESKHRHQVLKELIDEIKVRNLDINFMIQYRVDTGNNEPLLRSLKEVGLRAVFVGVESGVESVLTRFSKGTTRAEIDSALEIIQDLGFISNCGYLFYTPSTTFEELEQSVEYMMTPGSPTLLKLIGMTVLKGTPEERTARELGILYETEFDLHYRIPDRRVASFAYLLHLYSPIYEPIIADLYDALFMTGDLSPQLREKIFQEMKIAISQIRCLNQKFLRNAIKEASNEVMEPPFWLEELRSEFNGLNIFTQGLIGEGKAVLRSSGMKYNKY